MSLSCANACMCPTERPADCTIGNVNATQLTQTLCVGARRPAFPPVEAAPGPGAASLAALFSFFRAAGWAAVLPTFCLCPVGRSALAGPSRHASVLVYPPASPRLGANIVEPTFLIVALECKGTAGPAAAIAAACLVGCLLQPSTSISDKTAFLYDRHASPHFPKRTAFLHLLDVLSYVCLCTRGFWYCGCAWTYVFWPPRQPL